MGPRRRYLPLRDSRTRQCHRPHAKAYAQRARRSVTMRSTPRRHAAAMRLDGRRLADSNLVEDLGHLVTIESRARREKLVEDDAERPDIGAVIEVFGIPYLLG